MTNRLATTLLAGAASLLLSGAAATAESGHQAAEIQRQSWQNTAVLNLSGLGEQCQIITQTPFHASCCQHFRWSCDELVRIARVSHLATPRSF